MEKKLIEGYPSYAVYESGEIRNIRTGKRIEPQIKNGYAVFYPSVPNRPDGSRGKKMLMIHLVVSEAFIPKEEGMKYVVHIDGDKFNNKASNLVRRAKPQPRKARVQVFVEPLVITPEPLLVEEWVSINGVYGYEISNTGFVRNANTHKVLQHYNHSSGYQRVGTPSKTVIIHLKVAAHFLGPRTARFIRHKDGDRCNNAVTNLEWANFLGRAKKKKQTGQNHLTSVDIAVIKTRLLQGETQVALAQEFGVTQGNVSNIKRGHIWRHIQPNAY